MTRYVYLLTTGTIEPGVSDTWEIHAFYWSEEEAEKGRERLSEAYSRPASDFAIERWNKHE